MMDKQELIKQQDGFLAGATDIVVRDAGSLALAENMFLAGKALVKAVKEYWKPLKEAAQKSVNIVRDREREALDQLQPVVDALAKQAADYRAAEDTKRRIAELEARKVTDAVEASYRDAPTDEDAHAALVEAEPALQKAQADIRAHEVAKTSGVSYRDNWEYEIVDASRIPREYMMPNDKAIGAYVRAQKNLSSIPGVRVFARKVPVGRPAAAGYVT